MTRDELIEKVARGICKAVGDDPDANTPFPSFEQFPAWIDWTDEARAAIDIVLEEAARIADEAADGCAATFYASAGQAVAAHDISMRIAANVRALKSGGENE